MKQWEYLMTDMELTTIELDDFGRKGWELVAFNKTSAIFKRECAPYSDTTLCTVIPPDVASGVVQ